MPFNNPPKNSANSLNYLHLSTNAKLQKYLIQTKWLEDAEPRYPPKSVSGVIELSLKTNKLPQLLSVKALEKKSKAKRKKLYTLPLLFATFSK